jgi:hypothetical protein
MLMFSKGAGSMPRKPRRYIVRFLHASSAVVFSGREWKAAASYVASSAQLLCVLLTSGLCRVVSRTKRAASRFILPFCQCLRRCTQTRIMQVEK